MKNFILVLSVFFSQVLFAQNLKLPQLNPILNSQIASNDLTVVSDITANESKKLSFGEMDKRWQWTATTPLLKTGSESSVLSIPAATASVHGYLSSGDWTLFNAKQATVSASSPLIFSANNMSIPAATASVHGYLSSSDWTTFNAKVGTSTTDVLTNKDIDGGTASNARRITLPKDTKTNLDALTRKQGTIVYDTTSNKPYYDNGTILTAVGSGSGGGKNYIAGGDAESGTTGFATYSGGTTSPTSGTGGSPSVTWTTSATTPLESLNSFLLTKGATNRQGDGASYAFTIDRQDQAKVLQISFNYLVNSGTFVAGSPGVASDVTVWIYDVTNAVLIQPSSINLLSNSTTISSNFNATFQTASNSTSYRLIFHVGSTSAAAYTLKFDTIAVSPSVYVYGTPVTDWANYTPTGSWTTNTTYSGLWRQVGKNLEYRIRVTLAGAPNAASLTVNYLPGGRQVDTATLLATATDGSINIGQGVTKSAGTVFDVGVYYNGTASAAPIVKNASATYTGATSNITQALPATYANGDSIDIWGSVPILGWSSSVQMSSESSEARVISEDTYLSANQTGVNPNNSAVKVLFNTLQSPSTGVFDSANSRMIVQTSGRYGFDYAIAVNSTNVLANTYQARLYKNGSLYAIGRQISASVAASFTLDGTFQPTNAVAGDYFEIYIFGSGNNSASTLTIAGGYQFTRFSISRLSGPSAIAATESYNFRYTSSAGTGLTSGTNTLTFGTKDYDSHGLFNGTTFTPQIGGKFDCEVKIAINTISGLSTNYLRILVAGSTVSEKALAFSYSTASPFTFDLPDTINVLAGQAVTFQFQNGFGSTVNMDSTAARNSVACKRVGN